MLCWKTAQTQAFSNVVIMMVDFDFKDRYDIDDLRHIIELLRSENGCPWDKVQTHESIRTDLIEETYEVCEGIDKDSPEMLREELGDLLLQIVFHAQIEREKGTFDFGDVCNDICQKLVYRHPHVFGEVKAEDTDTVLKNWDALKKESKHQESFTETLESVPKTFPALLRGEKLCKRASRAGLPIDDPAECAAAIRSGLDKLEQTGFDKVNSQNQQTLGNLLLNFCNLDRILGVDGEKALTYASNQFIIDFGHAENSASEKGKTLDELSPEELSELKKIVYSGR